MAFKMKGFPYRSGFKHADQGHSEQDHQHIEVKSDSTGSTEESETSNIPINQYGTNHSAREIKTAINEVKSYHGEASEFLIKKWLEGNPSHDAKRVTEGIGTVEELYGG